MTNKNLIEALKNAMKVYGTPKIWDVAYDYLYKAMDLHYDSVKFATYSYVYMVEDSIYAFEEWLDENEAFYERYKKGERGV